MHSFRYNRSQRLFLIATPFALVLLAIILSRVESTRDHMHSCFIQRELEKPPPTMIPLGDGALHDYTVAILWIAMFLLALLPNRRSQGIYALAYVSLWFHGTYILLAALKAPLSDFSCAGERINFPNGISGHYCFFVFVGLTAPIFSGLRIQNNPQAPKSVLFVVEALMTVFRVGATATLYRTFMHGYHSMYQVFLGTALGMFSHVILDQVYFRDVSPSNVLQQATVLLANSLASFALYYQMWPHNDTDPVVTAGQIQFHIAWWLVLCIAAYFQQKRPEKVSTD